MQSPPEWMQSQRNDGSSIFLPRSYRQCLSKIAQKLEDNVQIEQFAISRLSVSNMGGGGGGREGGGESNCELFEITSKVWYWKMKETKAYQSH